MKERFLYSCLFLILSTSCFAGIIPKQGGFSFGLGHTSTQEFVKNPNTNTIFTDADTSEKLKYQPGFTLQGQYGYSENLSLFFKMIPFKYENNITGDAASYSLMHMGIKYLWLRDGFVKVFQDFSLTSYSLKNEFISVGEPIEISERFVSTAIYLMLDFQNTFILNVVKPYVVTEAYVDAPNEIEQKIYAKVGLFYELIDRINVMAEYNNTQDTFSFLMQLNF